MTLEEIFDFINARKSIIQTIYEDEEGKNYGEVEALYDDDLDTVLMAIEDLLS